MTIEPDLSNAAPFLMLALTSRGRVRIPGWPRETTQAGDALRGILTSMGAHVELDDDGLTRHRRGQPSRASTSTCTTSASSPRPWPPLAALASSPSRLRGIAHIRGHETDRLTALATELRGLGAGVKEHDDGLSITPATLHGGEFKTYADHRMAHAAVVLGSAVEGILVENVATTSKTFPGFAGVWSELF